MTSFVHLEYSNQHAGVARVESAIASAQQIRRNFSAARSLAMLLVSAITAAVMVAAYQVIDSMADGHLLALWIGMWVVAFAALAVFASTARNAVVSAKTALDSWSRNIAARRAHKRLLAMAKTDARLMTGLQAVISRNQADGESLPFVAPVNAVDNLASKRVASKVESMPAYHRLYV